MSARGFAIKGGGGIMVETIQATRIGAIVNWLVVRVGLGVRAGTADSVIENTFEEIRKCFVGTNEYPEVVEVQIKEILQ